jgi:hypothetical protein
MRPAFSDIQPKKLAELFLKASAVIIRHQDQDFLDIDRFDYNNLASEFRPHRCLQE